MGTRAISDKKRKIIDLSAETFRDLSVLAAANGKNLKVYIETILNNEAKMLHEETIYHEFLKGAESREIVSAEEKEAFERWLDV